MVGGGSGGAINVAGKTGGFGFYNKPIVQPFAQPFSIGGGGNGGNAAGNAGGNTTITNVGTVNGASFPAPGNAPGASLTYPNIDFVIGGSFGGPGPSGGGTCIGNAGGPGVLVVFENTGT